MVANPNHQSGHDNPILAAEDSFRLVAESHSQINSIAESARDAIKAFYTEAGPLADFIESKGTPVYVLRFSGLNGFCLWLLGFEPGFIPPGTGKRYHLLAALLGFQQRVLLRKPAHPVTQVSMAQGLFVLTKPLFTVGFMAHQLHHWLAFRAGLQGYCQRSQRLYKQFWHDNKGIIGKDALKMDVEDILALKAAINRDMEALQFLKDLTRDVLIPAKQARRIPIGKASA